MIREEIRLRAGKFRDDLLGLGWEREGKRHIENEGWILKTCICEGYDPEPYVEEYYNRVRYDADG